jgi:hypothetical protein
MYVENVILDIMKDKMNMELTDMDIKDIRNHIKAQYKAVPELRFRTYYRCCSDTLGKQQRTGASSKNRALAFSEPATFFDLSLVAKSKPLEFCY